MNIYKKMYLSLFNDVSDVIESFEGNENVCRPLINAQLKTEEMYMECEAEDESNE